MVERLRCSPRESGTPRTLFVWVEASHLLFGNSTIPTIDQCPSRKSQPDPLPWNLAFALMISMLISCLTGALSETSMHCISVVKQLTYSLARHGLPIRIPPRSPPSPSTFQSLFAATHRPLARECIPAVGVPLALLAKLLA
jgi:hypothetical protein